MLCTESPAGALDGGQQERDAFLRAIAEVETGGNAAMVGSLGERGLFQFRQETWAGYTSRPFMDAHDPAAAHEVAVRHYEWIRETLRRRGVEATPWLVAAAWNSGIGRVLSGRIPAVTRSYAERVVTLSGVRLPPIAGLDSPAPLEAPPPVRRYVIALAE